ncbi:MAG: prepilin-type N-terminal cleavage/methylation domain-containing protein [Planctomycetota bacterium]
MRYVVTPLNAKRAGLTLIEVLIASIVFTVGVLGLISAISSATIVDTVAQEHNLALEAAREVIERVKSEGAATLFKRISAPQQYAAADATADPTTEQTTQTSDTTYQATEGVPADVSGTQITAFSTDQSQSQTPSQAQNQGQGQTQGKGKGSGSSASKQSDEDAVGVFASAPVSDVEDSDFTPANAETVALSWFGTPLGEGNGIIDVDSDGNFAVPGLEPSTDDADGKVGKVVVTQFAPDVVEITVTVRWRGGRGVGQQVLRCRITDWQGQDGM